MKVARFLNTEIVRGVQEFGFRGRELNIFGQILPRVLRSAESGVRPGGPFLLYDFRNGGDVLLAEKM